MVLSRLCFAVMALASWFAHAQSPVAAVPVGAVEQLRGAGFAQSQGQPPRVLGRGLPLNEGDRLTTADNAVAIIKLTDGTRITLRPSTELVLHQFSYTPDSSVNTMVLQLLRGGLRALTGLINKSSPNAAKIQTSTATIGIRGTDFDARLCQAAECGGTGTAAPKRIVIAASARVLLQQGGVSALDEQGQRRAMALGSSIYPGDMVETANNASVLLAFKDDSKVSLGAGTRFRVDDFAYDTASGSANRSFVSLLRGSLRAVTGAIGKSNRQNVRFTSSTATIGIRGTELGMICTGLCAGDAPTAGAANGDSGLTVFTYEGAVVVNLTPPASSSAPPTSPLPASIELSAGQGVVVSGLAGEQQVRPLTAPTPALPSSSPSDVLIPPDTFLQSAVPEGAEGLYVFVREGHVLVSTARQQLDLGNGEAAYSSPALDVLRLRDIPAHIATDLTPLPAAANINITGLRPLASSDPICRPAP